MPKKFLTDDELAAALLAATRASPKAPPPDERERKPHRDRTPYEDNYWWEGPWPLDDTRRRRPMEELLHELAARHGMPVFTVKQLGTASSVANRQRGTARLGADD